MVTLEPTQEVPIVVGEDGSWRIKGTRVTVDVVVGQFLRGSTPEQIQDDFQTLPLASIYGVISYYLLHPEQVDEYLAERRKLSGEIHEHWDSQPGAIDLRKTLRKARDLRT